MNVSRKSRNTHAIVLLRKSSNNNFQTINETQLILKDCIPSIRFNQAINVLLIIPELFYIVYHVDR